VVTIEVDREWLTLQEAARLTGKSSSALRGAIQRRKLENVKKETGAIGEYWLIHRDELAKLRASRPAQPGSRLDKEKMAKEGVADSQDAIIEDVEYEFEEDAAPRGAGTWVNMVTLEYYDTQRDKWERERSNLEQGIMMYRYKYEELEQRLKVLPAPPELVSYRVSELEQKLVEEKRERESIVKGLRSTLETKEREAEREFSQKLQEEERKKEEMLGNLTIRLEEEKERALLELREKLQEEETIKMGIKHEMEHLMSLLEAEKKRSWWKKLLFMKLW
jgi:hypothetical protein